jgi:divalent metal cation (Fe/Co/Zn/Cd) transporter
MRSSPPRCFFLGLSLNAVLNWWWADPAAGYVLVFYAAREVQEIFSAHY